ncbi:glycosyltransferase family 2 protein [Botryobacter ruber]|uniref:glycosyltransferase family 2 protein n=1 Tax=Botryobacter ruber TaxID=2171629 RepID=UPI000E0A9A99|nr:glycosyltransferase family 2 protein [Botryobacter ruber]
MKKLSVIVVSYNVQYFLEQALSSVRDALAGIPSEIFVVDNNSTDGSVEMVAAKFPEVKLIANTGNVGFSKANNQAIEASTGEYVLLLNPDTVVQETTFRKCLAFMDEHPDAGGLGVKMIDGAGKFLPESKRGLPTPMVALCKIAGISRLFPKSRTFGRYHLGFLPPDELHEVEVLSGAFMLMRRETLDKVGLLDESFFMYGEDIDLSYRIVLGGYKNYYYPGTTIIHYKGESTHKGSLNYVLVFYKAMAIFYKKHFSHSNALFFSKLILLAIYLRAGLSVVMMPLRKMLGITGRQLENRKMATGRNVLVVGEEEEYERALQILLQSGIEARYVTRIAAADAKGKGSEFFLKQYKPSEIVFCKKSLTYACIIKNIAALSGKGITCSILPDSSDFIIGSTSKDDRGYYYTAKSEVGEKLLVFV